MKIRIVLADDHALVRAGMKSLLESAEGFEVVGEASTAVRRCASRKRSSRMSPSSTSRCPS
jgi:DNA-binding NarL/FixJ family response regulator